MVLAGTVGVGLGFKHFALIGDAPDEFRVSILLGFAEKPIVDAAIHQLLRFIQVNGAHHVAQ